ncbi:MAG: hypothetical protein U0835_06030 [Isosphaeraceae bacterium]
MPSDRIQVEEIQRRMADIRSRMHHEMADVVSGATSATDWRSYVRGRPILSLGIAFAAGYLAVPRRAQPPTVVLPQPVVQPVAAKAQPAEKRARLPVLRWAFSAIAPVALRAAQSYAVSYVEGLLENRDGGPGLRPRLGCTPLLTRATGRAGTCPVANG